MLASWESLRPPPSGRLGIFATGVNSKPTNRIKAWTIAISGRWLRGPLDARHGIEALKPAETRRDARGAREKRSAVQAACYCEEGSQTRSGGKRRANTFVATLRPISRPASISMR